MIRTTSIANLVRGGIIATLAVFGILANQSAKAANSAGRGDVNFSSSRIGSSAGRVDVSRVPAWIPQDHHPIDPKWKGDMIPAGFGSIPKEDRGNSFIKDDNGRYRDEDAYDRRILRFNDEPSPRLRDENPSSDNDGF